MAALRWSVIILLAAALVFLAGHRLWFSGSDTVATARIGGEKFTLRIAADRETQQRGLMEVAQIDRNGGMIFVYPEMRSPHGHGFWMKDCITDMDIIFLDSLGRVVDMDHMKVEPPRREGETTEEFEARLPRYTSDRPYQFAIELRAGTIERLDISEGDRVEIDLRRLKRLAH